jgi:hypothetical protein
MWPFSKKKPVENLPRVEGVGRAALRAEGDPPEDIPDARTLIDRISPAMLDQLLLEVELRNPRNVVRDLGMNTGTVREAVEVLKEANPGLGLYLDRFGYRTIGQSLRDISQTARMSILRRAEWLVQANPVARRAMDIRTNLVVSEGFTTKATTKKEEYHKQIQEVVDKHWESNEWEGRLVDRVNDLGVTGEMIRMIPETSRKGDRGGAMAGYFVAGMVLPHNVQAVVCDQWNAERLDYIRLNVPDENSSDNTGVRAQDYDIVQRVYAGKNAGTIQGKVLYLGVNRRPGASRGVSDLMAVSEWLDIYDQLMFNEAERTSNLLKFIWDVTLVGATSENVQDRAGELKKMPPNRGTVLVHNERETWKAIVPNLSSAQSIALTSEIFKLIWGGMGLPEHFFVEANTVNKASATEMAEPVWAWARVRKASLMDFLKLEHDMAIQVAIESGKINVPVEHRGIQVVSRDPDRTAYDVVGNTLNSMATALTTALTGQILDQKNAIGIFQHVIESTGFKIDPGSLPTELITPPGDGAAPLPVGDQAANFQKVVTEARSNLERNGSYLKNISS